MNKIIKNTIFQQLLFWLVSFIILHRLFSRIGDNGWTDIYFTLLFHLPLVFVVYGNYFLVQYFIIRNRKIGIYIIGLLMLLGIGIGLHFLTFDVLSDWLFPGYYFVTFYTLWEVLEFVSSYAIVSMLLFLSKNWFALKERQLILEKENHQIKLASLKAQINPHFLFNSLNNIYGITSSENKLSKAYQLKLSDALRYMIYDTEEAFVPLENEVTYLKNYLALEQLRINNNEAVQIDFKEDFSGYLIAPFILLPLIENCFKHCDKTNPIIDIHMTIDKGILDLQTKNNTSIDNKEEGGLGLNNLKSRLNLIYPDRHQLTIKEGLFYEGKLALNLEE